MTYSLCTAHTPFHLKHTLLTFMFYHSLIWDGCVLYMQPFVARSQILFGDDGPISPKRPVTLPEFAKQRELSGTLEAPLEEVHSKKSSSKSKVNELVGSDIFGPPPNVQPRTLFRIFTSTDATTSAIDPSSSLRKVCMLRLRPRQTNETCSF